MLHLKTLQNTVAYNPMWLIIISSVLFIIRTCNTFNSVGFTKILHKIKLHKKFLHKFGTLQVCSEFQILSNVLSVFTSIHGCCYSHVRAKKVVLCHKMYKLCGSLPLSLTLEIEYLMSHSFYFFNRTEFIIKDIINWQQIRCLGDCCRS